MKKTTYILAIFIASFINLQSQTVVLNPVSATTTFTPVAGTQLVNTYNGVGLVTFPSMTSDHTATDNAGNCLVANSITGTIDFDLGGTFPVNGIYFWNQNAGGPSTDTGVNGVNFYASTDGVNYTLIPGAPTSIQEVVTFLSPPETFTFSNVFAAFIRMEVLSNHGDASESGFAEIAFSYDSSTLGIETTQTVDFTMYPNPASNRVVVSSNLENATVEIYNITGKRIMDRKLNFGENRINVSELASGVYIARFVTENKVDTKKLIIK
ncbi:T9SS type A sorting domain-containing protein [Xanthomarina sp. GH4-25]|uniref:T9SS type A sorting domain-containing protein n=1 Tax=Xanthomarina sp. GH4-25 TaxID=3349335 RepID=UPI000D6791A3|nr:hypothetical protein DI383_04665 [Flavobacteriaceae bacterium LYZ1037]